METEVTVTVKNLGGAMRLNVLLVGIDPALNRMRVQLLRSRHNVATVSAEESFQRLQHDGADLLLVCHSVPIHLAASIIELAAERRRVKRILWLSEWQTVPGLVASGQAVIQIDSRKQPWLLEVERILQTMLPPPGTGNLLSNRKFQAIRGNAG